MQLTCFQCGGDFEGRPNRLYCCSICQKRAEYRRGRIVSLRARREHTKRMVQIARVAGGDTRLHEHRLAVIESELLQLTETSRESLP